MTEQLTRVHIEGALARANAAPEGPWEVDTNYPFSPDLVGIFIPAKKTYAMLFDRDSPPARTTARLAAASRSDVPAMAEALIRVLDLHEPETVEVMEQVAPKDYDEWPTVLVSVCSHCLPGDVRDMVADVEADLNDVRRFQYPCATLRAITGQELGGAVRG